MACSILLSMATTLAPEELREKKRKKKHVYSFAVLMVLRNI